MFRIIAVMFFCATFYSQNPLWDSVSMGFPSWDMPYNVNLDTFNSKVVVHGSFKHFDNQVYNNILLYDGLNVDSLGNGIDGNNPNAGNPIHTICSYKGKLYAGGGFSVAGGKAIPFLAVWDGSSWDSLPVGCPNGNVGHIFVFNNELYIAGNFNKIGSQPTEGLAKWDGVNFTPFNGLPYSLYYTWTSTVYNGELYLGGNNYCSGVPDCDIVKYDGTNWSVPGGGILGSASWVNDLKVYNNKLYVAGYFTENEGNAGNFLMTWDGNQWKKVFDYIDDYIWALEHLNGKLLVGGCFENINGVNTGNLVAIDSNTFCTLGSQITQCIVDIQSFGNTFLISGGFTQIDTTSFLCLAQWGGGNYSDTCAFAVGQKEIIDEDNFIKVFPNPANDLLNIKTSFQIEAEIQILDLTGVPVLTKILQAKESHTLDISQLSSGMYFIQVFSAGRKYSQKFLKN